MQQNNKARFLVPCLIASLGLNIYFGGHMVGRWMSHGSEVRQEWRERDQQLRQTLSPQDYEALKAHKKDKRDEFQADRRALTDACNRVETVMQADSFDEDALDAALDAEKDVKLDMLKRMRLSRDQLEKKLSKEGREAFERVMRQVNPDICRRRLGDTPPAPSSKPAPVPAPAPAAAPPAPEPTDD